MSTKMPKQYTCETDCEDVQNYYINWKIKNFSKNKDKGFHLFSDVFDIEIEPSTKSSLKIQLFYIKIDTSQFDFSAKYKIFGGFHVVNMTLAMTNSRNNQCADVKLRKNENKFSLNWLTSQYILNEDKDGSLQIKCFVDVLKYNGDIEKKVFNTPVLDDDNSLSSSVINDFEKMYINKPFSDLKVVSLEGTEFAVHRCVLSSRCPYFEKQFEDLHLSKITINMKAEVLEEVLKYIYTGRVPKVKEMSMDLIEAAFKLELKGLISLCEAVVISQINIADAPKTLILADDYAMLALRKEVISFTVANAEEVGELDIWREMMKSHPHLIAEVTFQLQVANSKK